MKKNLNKNRKNIFYENLQKILLTKLIFLNDQLAKIFREKRKNASTLGSDRVRRSYSGVLIYYRYVPTCRPNMRRKLQLSSENEHYLFSPRIDSYIPLVAAFLMMRHHQGSWEASITGKLDQTQPKIDSARSPSSVGVCLSYLTCK